MAALSHSDGWWRDTAHRLIYERQDPAAVGPLRDLLGRGSAVAKAHALWSLEGLGALADADLLAALADPEPRVAEHALELAGRRLDDSAAVRAAALGLAGSDDARVRFAVALTAGATRDPRAADALAAVARRDAADRWARTAVLCSAAGQAEQLLARLTAGRSFARSESGSEMVEALAEVVGARNRPDEVRQALADAASLADPGTLLRGLGRGLARVGGRLDPAEPAVDRWLREAEAATRDGSRPEPARVEAIGRLALAPYDRARHVLAGLLDPQTPGAVQAAALRALAGYARPEVAEVVLARMRQLAPAARGEAVATLLAQVGRHRPAGRRQGGQGRRGRDRPGRAGPARRASGPRDRPAGAVAFRLGGGRPGSGRARRVRPGPGEAR